MSAAVCSVGIRDLINHLPRRTSWTLSKRQDPLQPLRAKFTDHPRSPYIEHRPNKREQDHPIGVAPGCAPRTRLIRHSTTRTCAQHSSIPAPVSNAVVTVGNVTRPGVGRS